MKALLLLPLLALLLGGCGPGTTIGSLAGGECKLTHTPPFAVRGKTTYDQNWADDTTEALVRGCNQPRPKARPASLDAPKRQSMPVKAPARIDPAVIPAPGAAVTPLPPLKKKRWWQRKAH